MQKERYPSEESHFPKKVTAKVILAKCAYIHSHTDNLFGIRVQKFGSDWMRTWAFKIDASRAHNEGYDKESVKGTFNATESYNGCPYCNSYGFVECPCGKISCYKPEKKKKIRACPWCGESYGIVEVDSFDLQGGGY